jgi:hypothetical protein
MPKFTTTATASVGSHWHILFCALCALGGSAAADTTPSVIRFPAQFERTACYQLVRHEGRAIAWARWEVKLDVRTARAMPVIHESIAIWLRRLARQCDANAMLVTGPNGTSVATAR